MSRLALNKSSLQRQIEALAQFQRYLPALDLKRRQLLSERAKAKIQFDRLQREYEAVAGDVGSRYPMLSTQRIPLEGLVTLEHCEFGDENILGTHLIVLERLQLRTEPYRFFSTPHWLDDVMSLLERSVELSVQLYVARTRYEALEVAVRRITQRVNLFEKVKIPETKENIRTIRVYLADAERAAVVRAKIAKTKQETQARGEP